MSRTVLVVRLDNAGDVLLQGPLVRAVASAAVRVPAGCAAAATSAFRVTGVGTRIPVAPAAAAASTSAPMSPTTTHRAASTPSSAQAVLTMPGAGLRQEQPSSGPCGQ